MDRISDKIMLIGLKVKARASKDAIGEFVEIEGKQYLKISVKAPPEDGKANLAIISLLASHYNVPKSSVKIISGHSSSVKIASLPDKVTLS